MKAEISIILPAHNGSDTLEPCLEALGKVARPDVGTEVFLIDNASDDATPDIMARHAAKHGWHVLSEPRRGKSFALNTGIDAATGELVVFMDDDILPDTGWLQAYIDASKAFPDASVFAGQIRPKWPGPVPGWLQRMTDEGRSCGCTALDRKAGPYPAIDVKGGNVMMRREAIGHRRFDTEAGNFDGSAAAVGGEDTRFVTQVATGETDIIFVPEARADHMLQADEVSLSALFRRQMRIGRSSATFGRFTLVDKILTVPAIGAYAVAVAMLMLVGQRDHAMKQLFKIATRIGRIEHWRQRHG